MTTRRKSSGGGGMFAGMKLDEELVMLGGIGLVAWVIHSGGIQAFFQKLTAAATTAAANAGGALINAAGEAASGVVTGAASAIGAQVGLPTVGTLTDDPYVARYIIDAPNGGQMAASTWATSSAYLNAQTIPAGQGIAPNRYANPAIYAVGYLPYVPPVATDQSGTPLTFTTGSDGGNAPVCFDEFGNQVPC